jgi:hypothetical protein
MAHNMGFTIDRLSGPESISVDIERGYNLGFTIRDAAKMQAHLDEVAKEGVTPPVCETPPIIFPISPWAWLTDSVCLIQTEHTSGEIEIFMLDLGDELLVGVGSDHTDRKLEGTDIPWSKQVAPNMVAPTLWAWTDVAEHWDECTLDSWVTLQGERTHYQSTSVSEFWTPPEMVAGVAGRAPADTPRVFVSGTVVSLGHQLIYGDTWELALHDPVLERTISHTYDVVVLGAEITN